MNAPVLRPNSGLNAQHLATFDLGADEFIRQCREIKGRCLNTAARMDRLIAFVEAEKSEKQLTGSVVVDGTKLDDGGRT